MILDAAPAFFIVQPAAQITFVDIESGQLERSLHITVQENAQLIYKNTEVKNSLCIMVELYRNAQIELFFSCTASTQLEVVVVHKEPYAQSKIQLIVRGKQSDKISCTTRQEHLAPSTTSSLSIKSVLFDQAQAILNGNIYIAEQAVQTIAEQEVRTLLIGNNVCAQTTPALEILTDDVQCRHASALGAIDKEQLFYCAARGIDEQTAQQLIIDGFLSIC